MNLNSNNNQENYIHFKQPKLLKINLPPSVTSSQSQQYDYGQRNYLLAHRINKFKKNHEQNKEEQDNYELNRNIINFYKNPFYYMEYLAKNYFIQNAKSLDNLEIKKEMTDNFKRLCYQIEDHIQKFTSNEEIKLKKLQKEVENKLKGGILPLNNDSKIDYNKQNAEKNYSNNDMLSSIPVNMKDEELMRRIFGNIQFPQSPFDGITTTGNATNFVINKNITNLNEDNLYLNALSCLKGDRIVAPKHNFISVKELNLNDINPKKFVDSSNMLDLKKNMKIEQKIKKKFNDIKKNEKQNLEELISFSNNYIKKMEQYQKEKEMLVNELKQKLNKDFEKNAIQLAMKKLSICEKNLEDMKLNYNEAPDNKICNWNEKKEILEKEFRNTQSMVDNFLNGESKFKINRERNLNKKNKRKKKRNNSAIPYKNNPFLYFNFKK